MNAPHFHLLLNHIPVLGTAFGFGLLCFGLWRKSEELKKTALGVFVIVALVAVPTHLTGEPAEDGIKSISDFSKPIIERHEEAAGAALAGIVALGAVALVGMLFFRRGKTLPAWFSFTLVAAALIVSGLMAWTANLGGQIRHSEIRVGNSPPAVTGSVEDQFPFQRNNNENHAGNTI